MHEINLLPPSRRLRLRRQWLQETMLHVFRHFQATLLLVTVLGGLTGGFLQLSLLFYSANTESQLVPLVRQYQSARQEIIRKNALIDAVADTSENRVVWSDRLSELFESVPSGISIDRLQVTKAPKQLIFSGRSVNRNSLIILQGRLNELEWAVNVDAPLDNLLDKDNPIYSFVVEPVEALDDAEVPEGEV